MMKLINTKDIITNCQSGIRGDFNFVNYPYVLNLKGNDFFDEGLYKINRAIYYGFNKFSNVLDLRNLE